MGVDVSVDALPEETVTVIPVEVPQTDNAVVELAREAGEGNALLMVLIDRVASLEDRIENLETTVGIALDTAISAAETAVEAVEVITEVAAEVQAEDAPTEGSEEYPGPPPDNDTDEPPIRQHFMFRERGEFRRK